MVHQMVDGRPAGCRSGRAGIGHTQSWERWRGQGGEQVWEQMIGKHRARRRFGRSHFVLVFFLGLSWLVLGSCQVDQSARGLSEPEERGEGKGRSETGRRLLWSFFGVNSQAVVEPTSIPDKTKSQPSIEEVLGETVKGGDNPGKRHLGPPRLAIFTAPRPFTGDENESQRRAIQSWLRLKPTPQVFLLGNHPSFHAVAAEFGDQVSVDPRIDCNYHGVPLFNSMVARAQAAKQPYSMVVGPDVIILSDIMGALKVTRNNFTSFVMLAAQSEVARFPKGLLDPLGKKDDSVAVDEATIKGYVLKHGKKVPHAKVGFWLWNNSPVPLHNASMPPFVFQRGKHDHWLAHEVVAAGYRALVDATDLVTCVNVRLVRSGAGAAGTVGVFTKDSEEPPTQKGLTEDLSPVYAYTPPPAPGTEPNRSVERVLIRLRKWSLPRPNTQELVVNRHLAETHTSEALERNQGLVGTPWKLARCTRNKRRIFCVKSVNCTSRLHGTPAGFADPSQDPDSSFQWVCNHVSLHAAPAQGRALPRGDAAGATAYNKLEDLLPFATDERKIVTLVAVSSLYKDMLMSFVCMLRRLDLPNPLVAALDPELYHFAEEQGLAVFYDNAARDIRLENARNGTACKFGTPCFKLITKLKSRVVLHVLNLGYNVLWSDVDIVWFRDPLPELMAYGPGVFPVQSDQPRRYQPPNGSNGTSIVGGAINSGFYYARSEPKIIQAFEAIVADAKKTNTSEQPSFYRVLCGENGTNTVGADECIWPKNGLRTVFVPRNLHPNGKIFYYWHDKRTAALCVSKGCATLHNNWIKGKQAKINRFKEKGLWYYDPNNRICLHTWYRNTRGLPLFPTNTDEEVEDQSRVE